MTDDKDLRDLGRLFDHVPGRRMPSNFRQRMLFTLAEGNHPVGPRRDRTRGWFTSVAVATVAAFAVGAIERDLAVCDPETRRQGRNARSRPVLAAFLRWLRAQQRRVLPKSALGSAVTYCLHQWTPLTAFLQDGRLAIDNNRAERAIKPFVIGRKNWLFANTPRGARASAIAYSLIETAKANGCDPRAYLEYLLAQLPNRTRQDPATWADLLPWFAELPDGVKTPKKAEV